MSDHNIKVNHHLFFPLASFHSIPTSSIPHQNASRLAPTSLFFCGCITHSAVKVLPVCSKITSFLSEWKALWCWSSAMWVAGLFRLSCELCCFLVITTHANNNISSYKPSSHHFTRAGVAAVTVARVWAMQFQSCPLIGVVKSLLSESCWDSANNDSEIAPQFITVRSTGWLRNMGCPTARNSFPDNLPIHVSFHQWEIHF